ncbi:MAG: TonB-dependent receptor domain-containing protein, partial [Pyrinomonadaceae bacterium]
LDTKVYTFRIDAVPTERQRVFVRTTITRRDSTNSLQFLPGDPDAVEFQDRSYSIAGVHTWAITNALNNVITIGLTKSSNVFTPPTVASFPNVYSGGPIGAAFPSPSYQDRHVFVPTVRDDVSWTKGSHTFQFGFSWKPIQQDAALINDFNFVALGIGGLTTALNSTLRPADISATVSKAGYDSAFAFSLGRFASNSTNYNYDPTGTALVPGTGKFRSYAYKEYEGYFQDNWKIKSNLTLNLGVRYQLYPAPYDRNGFQADNTTDFKQLIATRVANAAAGIASDSSEPFLTYDLSGKVNNGPPLYKTDKNNFAPRLGFAYNPSFGSGFLGKVFGERKTVIHGNASIVYDRVGGAITFIENQVDYLFANSAARTFGSASANTALLTDPRFTTVNGLPAGSANTPPVITRPFTPFVDNGSAFGLAEGDFNYTIDHNFKIPYAYTFNLGYQRELPGNLLLDVSYVGRLGKSLFVQSDVAQVMNFKDNASGQFLFPAFNNVQSQLQAGAAVLTPQPWLENQMSSAIAAAYGPGITCASFGEPSCTQLAVDETGDLMLHGDTSDLVSALNGLGMLRNNVGMSSQFGTNSYISNQGKSSYHGMLVSLQKRFSKGFEFEANYTYSKSLDNNSSVVNTVTGGFICDVTNPNLCKGPSDFDIRHLFNANFIWDLPFGRGRAFGSNMNKWVNAVLGGWALSGIASARSGLAFSSSSGSFPLGFNLNAPGINTNDSALAVDVHTVPGVNGGPDSIAYFKDPAAAAAAIRYPTHGELGSRNVFRSPAYYDLDMGLYKKFDAPWNENQKFTIRADSFNVTNTNAFSTPNLTLGSSSFGLITASLSAPREFQFSIRFDF